MGCPRATAPPQALTFSGSSPRILLFARATAANAWYKVSYKRKGSASLISHLAISFTASPARFRAIGIARLGAIVKSMGFVAASPHDSILAIGFTDDDCDRSRVARTNAEAPSLIAEAFAAVTVPSFLSIRYSCSGDELERRFQCWYFFNFETFIFFVR